MLEGSEVDFQGKVEDGRGVFFQESNHNGNCKGNNLEIPSGYLT